jgi:YggT family protein
MRAISISLWYLLDTVFSFYVMLLMMRLLLQRLHANYYNPLCQFVIRLTTPVVRPLQHWLPTWHGVDTAVLTVVVALTAIKFVFMGWMVFAASPRFSGLFVWTVGDILQNAVHLFMVLIIGRVVLSWIHNVQLAPILEVLYKLTEPTLRPVKRIIPPVSGYDLSPLFLILVLQLLVILVAAPMENYGQFLAFQGKLL